MVDETQYELFSSAHSRVICGVDEAGRGPLAGPVCAAAVILPDDFPMHLLNDSKKLSERKRALLEPIIKEHAIAWAVAWSNHRIIDEMNILQATLFAMKKAVEKIHSSLHIDLVLIDGNKIPKLNIPAQAVIKGDATVSQIMAASILAKTARDRVMCLADAKWPNWGFATHKGYPSVSHRKACQMYGLSPIHRKSFTIKPVATFDP